MAVRRGVHEGEHRFATRSEAGEARRAHRIERQGRSALWRDHEKAADECRRAAREFEDGSEQDIDAIIWATGYRSDFSWIEVPAIKGASGNILHRRGVTDAAGLFFIGLTWQHTGGRRSSAS